MVLQSDGTLLVNIGSDRVWTLQRFTREPGLPPMAGEWVDPTGDYYGGAMVRIGGECALENPSEGVWQTATFRCDLDAGEWHFIETRLDGRTYSSRMVLQSDG